MTHDYNTRGKKDAGAFEDALKSIEDNLQKRISGLRDDILNINDVIIQRLQEDNLKLKEKVNSLEDKLVQIEIKNNSLEQYQPAYQLKKTTVGILNSINLDLDSSDVESCQRIGKSKDGKPRKTFIRMASRKFCKELSSVFINQNQIQLKNKAFINENLTDCSNKI